MKAIVVRHLPWVAILALTVVGCSKSLPPQSGGRTASYWAEVLQQPDPDVELRRKAATKLGTLILMDPVAMPALLQALKDSDADVRSNAADRWASIREREAARLSRAARVAREGSGRESPASRRQGDREVDQRIVRNYLNRSPSTSFAEFPLLESSPIEIDIAPQAKSSVATSKAEGTNVMVVESSDRCGGRGCWRRAGHARVADEAVPPGRSVHPRFARACGSQHCGHAPFQVMGEEIFIGGRFSMNINDDGVRLADE